MDRKRIARLKLAARLEATAQKWEDLDIPSIARDLREKAAKHRIAARAN